LEERVEIAPWIASLQLGWFRIGFGRFQGCHTVCAASIQIILNLQFHSNPMVQSYLLLNGIQSIMSEIA
jgi:hypothetical protein